MTPKTLLLAQILFFTGWTLSAAERPNVLVIMVDDLGFSDIGCYGSEIETPTLDSLAANGLRFSQFYNTAKCHSSRISLLTGKYAFQAGNTKLDRAVTSAKVLADAGYFTAMAGKWHLDKQPTDFGFQRYFGHLSGSTNYFTGDNSFRLNGEIFNVPDKGFYTTVADVDYAIKFLDEARQTDQPWYLYVAFNAPHAPLQPMEEDYRKYAGKYNVGWDVIREARLAKQRKLNLFGEETIPSPRPDNIPAWSELPSDRQNWESRRMQALAGMIDRVDQEVGRLVDNLKSADEFENTMILFVSDNGACPYDRTSTGQDQEPFQPNTRWSDSTGWAWCRNSPFRYYKQNQFEGGICTPGIVHWPNGLKTKPGAITNQPAHLVDVLPTLAEIGEAAIPTEWEGQQLEPISGVSLSPVLRGEKIESRPPIHFLFSNDRGLRIGPWKLVSFQQSPWELYNLDSDRTELKNLASQESDRVAYMVTLWTEMSKDVLHAPASAYSPVSKQATPHRHPEWTDFSKPLGPIGKATSNANSKSGNQSKRAIRARKDTQLKVVRNQLQLTCTGTDSGLAFQQLPVDLPPGPYQLSFEVKSNASGSGEIYYTIDSKTKLPNGEHVAFQVRHDDNWHSIAVELPTNRAIQALRLDPCSGPGNVAIRKLTLNAHDEVVASWPK